MVLVNLYICQCLFSIELIESQCPSMAYREFDNGWLPCTDYSFIQTSPYGLHGLFAVSSLSSIFN
jgi:hypothetical protein